MITPSHSFFSSHNGLSLTFVSDTFMCMRLNQFRGPTPQLLGKDDSQGTKNVIKIQAVLIAPTDVALTPSYFRERLILSFLLDACTCTILIIVSLWKRMHELQGGMFLVYHVGHVLVHETEPI